MTEFKGDTMKLEFVPKFITLLAGAIVCIITIVKDMDVTYSLELLLATLIIFYIIGLIAKAIIQKVMDGNMFVKQDNTENENIEDVKIDNDKESEENDSKNQTENEV